MIDELTIGWKGRIMGRESNVEGTSEIGPYCKKEVCRDRDLRIL